MKAVKLSKCRYAGPILFIIYLDKLNPYLDHILFRFYNYFNIAVKKKRAGGANSGNLIGGQAK